MVSVLPWSGPENGWRQPRRRVVYSLRLTIFALSVLLAVVVSASSDELAAAWLRGIASLVCLPGGPIRQLLQPGATMRGWAGNMCFVFCSLPELLQRGTVMLERLHHL